MLFGNFIELVDSFTIVDLFSVLDCVEDKFGLLLGVILKLSAVVFPLEGVGNGRFVGLPVGDATELILCMICVVEE